MADTDPDLIDVRERRLPYETFDADRAYAARVSGTTPPPHPPPPEDRSDAVDDHRARALEHGLA